MAIGSLMAKGNHMISQPESILVDGHVHFHSCYDLDTLLDSAQCNFCHAASILGLGNQFSAILLLTESCGTNFFASLKQRAVDGTLGHGWRFQPTLDQESLAAISPAGFQLTIIAGRQIVTAERLEVLAVCTDELFDDGGMAPEVIDSVTAANGIAIVPWGFGKWTGRRKKVINRLMGNFAERPFHLGDNSGRISVWREPSQFGRARSQGQRIFRGTDPMPFPGQEKRIGSFGFSISGSFNRSTPTTSMRILLGSGNAQPTSYGALESAMVFTKHQLMMQTRKWRREIRSNTS
jgi:hypothetical protein